MGFYLASSTTLPRPFSAVKSINKIKYCVWAAAAACRMQMWKGLSSIYINVFLCRINIPTNTSFNTNITRVQFLYYYYYGRFCDSERRRTGFSHFYFFSADFENVTRTPPVRPFLSPLPHDSHQTIVSDAYGRKRFSFIARGVKARIIRLSRSFEINSLNADESPVKGFWTDGKRVKIKHLFVYYNNLSIRNLDVYFGVHASERRNFSSFVFFWIRKMWVTDVL